jgi:protoporphyrinogen oxidase
MSNADSAVSMPCTGRSAGADDRRVLVIGGGPAGLTAAWELCKLGIPGTVFEADGLVGGLARTGDYKGYRYDIGGHRFFTKLPFVQQIWDEILGADLIERPRLSRIHYRGKFFDYPLRPGNALRGLGPVESARILLSFLGARLRPSAEERNLEEWVCNRFGRRLFQIFFQTYTEKVWGIPCTEIGADWAAQRIKNLDLYQAVRNALVGSHPGSQKNVITTLIDSFLYPRLGPGMMWERCCDLLAGRGWKTHLSSPVVRIRHSSGRVTGIDVRGPDGQSRFEPGTHVISSMPMRDLARVLDPPPPPEVRAAAERLRYRDFLTVLLVVDQPDLFPDNWIYIHSPEVKLGRVQNFKNWSPEMVPDGSRTSLGLEYFVEEGDQLWAMPDAELVELGGRECAQLGLLDAAKVIDGCAVRTPKAYPVYDAGYQEAVATLRGWLDGLPNLQLVGRNGQHRYNNQDHSMATAVYAARNLAGAQHDIWAVNVEDEYHEEAQATPAEAARTIPAQATHDRQYARLVAEAFARYDAVALGVATGAVAGSALFLATMALLLRGGKVVGPMLSLLASYLLGYHVTWLGALVGLGEGFVGGFLFGYLLARAINATTAMEEAAFRRRAELAQILEPS